MFQKLVSHNNDIGRLVERGYSVAFDSNYLIVRDIPYLDAARELKWGAFVCKIDFVDHVRITPTDHQVFFAGGVPHSLDGTPIPNLGGGVTQLALSKAADDVVVQRAFSNKPRSGKFQDHFDKIENYVAIIAGPAMALHKATPYTFRVCESVDADSVFKVRDTLTSRAEIVELTERFRDDVVAIIGLGGTGAYVLDFLAKTAVREIRGFDPDTYHVHTAFRSPGRMLDSELGRGKAAVYGDRYNNFRNGVSIQPTFIDVSSAADVAGVTFAFVCVDKGSSRAGIFDLLLAQGIPFIDVGMGLTRKDRGLNGMARMTYFSRERGQAIRDMELAQLADSDDDIYRTAIQISELNALNACLAVIKFKQLRGFYEEAAPHYHVLFGVGDLATVARE